MLEKILTTHPEITGGGEVFRMAEIFSDHMAMCTCGVKLENCPVWGSVRVAAAKEAVQYGGFSGLHTAMMQVDGRLIKKQAHDPKELEMWLRLNRIAFKALRAASPDANWVVDSSKTARGAARRPSQLMNHGANIRFIGVKRLAGSVLRSISNGTNRAIEGSEAIKPSMVSAAKQQLYAYVGWAMASAVADDIILELGTKAHGIRFEDLTNDPEGQLKLIASWLGLSFPADWEARMITTPRHMIGGNRNRFRPEGIHRSTLPYKNDVIGGIGLSTARRLVKLGVL